MEHEYPTLEELESTCEWLAQAAFACEQSGACPFDWANAWQLEHIALDELGCPGYCLCLSAADDMLWQDPQVPTTDEIPF